MHSSKWCVPNDDLTVAIFGPVQACQLRAIRPGPVTRRPLDEVLSGKASNPKRRTRNPVWEVEEQISSVSIQGSFGDLLEFLTALDNDARILLIDSLQLHPLPDTTEGLVLDLHVKTIDLLHNPAG